MSAHGIVGVVVCGGARTAWQLCSASGWARGAPGQEAALAMQSPEVASSTGLLAPAGLAHRHPCFPPAPRAPGSPRSAAAGNGDPGNPESPRPGPAPETLSPQPPSASQEMTAGTGCAHPAGISL